MIACNGTLLSVWLSLHFINIILRFLKKSGFEGIFFFLKQESNLVAKVISLKNIPFYRQTYFHLLLLNQNLDLLLICYEINHTTLVICNGFYSCLK